MRLIDADELTEAVWRERLDTRERIADLVARQPTVKGVTAMTNSDKLYKLCIYDLLCRINDGLIKADSGNVCVVDALNGHYAHSLHCVDKSCDKCILEYLDEECDAD